MRQDEEVAVEEEFEQTQRETNSPEDIESHSLGSPTQQSSINANGASARSGLHQRRDSDTVRTGAAVSTSAQAISRKAAKFRRNHSHTQRLSRCIHGPLRQVVLEHPRLRSHPLRPLRLFRCVTSEAQPHQRHQQRVPLWHRPLQVIVKVYGLGQAARKLLLMNFQRKVRSRQVLSALANNTSNSNSRDQMRGNLSMYVCTNFAGNLFTFFVR